MALANHHQKHYRSGGDTRRIIFAHGSSIRSFTLRPFLAGGIIVAGLAFGTLYIAATAYLFFRDDLIGASLAQQARLKYAYEDRITELRAQIDRITSRQLLDQEEIDAELQRLLGRQAALDARQDLLNGLATAAGAVGIIAAPAVAAAPVPVPAANPLRAPEDPTAVGGPEVPETTQVGPLGSLMLRPGSLLEPTPVPATPREEDIALVQDSLDRLEGSQIAFIRGVDAEISQTAAEIVGILDDLGHDHPFGKLDDESAVGGPFVPADGPSRYESFSTGIGLVTERIEELESLRDFVHTLPLGRPLAQLSMSSGFGNRRDPFLGRTAVHEGTDFRAVTGTTVSATAPGEVIFAGTNGGYGKMVEIDHGDGVTTRYGHMSRILVTVGENVEAGEAIGRVGSTGRSTGPHLHYEIRLADRAINPMPYLNAGRELLPLL